MTFVMFKNDYKTNHFRHVSLSGSKTSGGGFSDGTSAQPPIQCGCSSRHLDAQALLRDHDYTTQPVVFTEWRDCKKPSCCKTVYTATGEIEVRLEVREQGGKFVSDVVYYKDGKARMRVEVFATHKADRIRRVGTEFVEVRAEHIVESFKNAGTSPITVRGEDSCTGQYDVCLPCAERRERERLQAEARRVHAAKLAEERRRLEAEEREENKQRLVHAAKLAKERHRLEAEEREKNKQRREAEMEKERVKTAALDAEREAERAEREANRAAVAAGMLVKPTPNFSVTLGTDVPDTSQGEIDRRRKERMHRRDAAVQAKRRVCKKHK